MSILGSKTNEIYVLIKDKTYIFKNNKFTLYSKINNSPWLNIKCYKNSALGLNKRGDLYLWGNNVFTNHITLKKSILIDKINNKNWLTFDINDDNYAAINADNDLYIFYHTDFYGNSGQGTLVLNTSRKKINKVNRMDNNSKWLSVSLGSNHTCAINAAGKLYGWGLGEDNILGLNISTSIVSDTSKKIYLSTKGNPPVEIPIIDNSQWVKVMCGNNYTFAFNKLGDLYSWGQNGLYGLLGLNTERISQFTITKVPLMNNSKWIKILCSNYHILGLNDKNELYAWGDDSLNFFNGNTYNKINKVLIKTNVTDMSVGYNMNVALLKNGKYFIWGKMNSNKISKTVNKPSSNHFTNTIEKFTDYCNCFRNPCDIKRYYLLCIIIVIIMIIIIIKTCCNN